MESRMNGRKTPEVLIAQARAGDGEALGILLALYHNYLALLARCQISTLVRLHMNPSDLVQEALLEANRDFNGFAGASEGELVAWLRRILARSLADLVRREQAEKRGWKRNQSLEAMLERSSLTVHEALAAGIPSPSAEVSRREQAVILADALSRLPADYREIIVMRHLDRLKFEEIAARMHRSAGAVRKLWTRALIKLRSELEHLV
jgi:RNA polymerase sigma-70 factor, ECF subfamily